MKEDCDIHVYLFSYFDQGPDTYIYLFNPGISSQKSFGSPTLLSPISFAELWNIVPPCKFCSRGPKFY